MFNKLLSKFEALFPKSAIKQQLKATEGNNAQDDKKLNKTLEYLYQIFVPLDKINESFSKEVIFFILNAECSEVLLKLQNLPDDKALLLLGKPGTYKNYWGTLGNETLAKQSILARQKFYTCIFEYLDSTQIIRFAKVLEAASQQRNFTNLYKKVPSWFIYLTIDIFKDDEHNKSLKTITKYWTQQKLQQLLEEDQLNSGIELAAYLFERKDTDSYYNIDKLSNMLILQDTVEYLKTHLNQLQKTIPTLSVNGQENFLNYATKHNDILKLVPSLIVKLAVGKSKKIQTQAISLLASLEQNDYQKHLNDILLNGSAQERSLTADLLARLGEENLTILEQALTQETQKSVQQAIQTAIQRLKSVDDAGKQDQLEIPPRTPLVKQKIPQAFTQDILDNYNELLAKAKQEGSKYSVDKYKKTKQETLLDIVDILNGDKVATEETFSYFLEKIITFKNKYKKYPEFSIFHAAHLINWNKSILNWSDFFDLLNPEEYLQYELRDYVQVLETINVEDPKRCIAKGILAFSYQPTLLHFVEDNPDKFWPFFAENIEYLTEALGLSPSLDNSCYGQFQPIRAIEILRCFPTLPSQFVPRLLEFALGENKKLRMDAQETLQKVPDIHQRAIEALDSGKQEIRITAIEWLARLQNQQAIKPLNALLKKEKKEVVRAALLTALEQLGQDISAYLQSEVLLKEAEQGLKGKLSVSFTWFNFESLPKVKWRNGTEVDPQIIKWWVVLAEKLKEPKANELLQRYMTLLDEKSQQQLANHLLQSFIVQDTLCTPIDEATAYAVDHAPSRLEYYKKAFKTFPNDEYYAKYANITLQEVIEEIKQEQLAVYIGSAIKSKGMLALIATAQGSFAVKQLQDYMKQHYTRRAQIEAMLSALSISNDPLIIQLLLSVARRYRTNSVQELANTLISEIAERNHWTNDELADRTIPTAGLDENGILYLHYGSRDLTAIVDDNDKFILRNEDGKEIKALPAARQDDDENLVKEAKTMFSTSKKELKQVLDMQTSRLYEAMCSERQWPVAEWMEYLFAHPIMKRLLQRLVWLEIKPNGEKISFRPSDDGSLLNLADDEIKLDKNSKIQISHAVLIDQEEAKAWLAHFKDYKVKFLFEQMTHQLPTFEDEHATEIADHKGWVTDTFNLRGVVTKMGYKRADAEDGGCFYYYFKSYQQLGIDVEINFSGSYLPEENIPAVLHELIFSKKGQHYWNSKAIALKEVPPILLAESYADYLKVAEATNGFDSNWKNITL